ncbi:Putative cytochrome P450 [Colletotrichum destructivum]|uniref:Cytochrome P450 n=1 Tax=Colletotrichum destructivum TaxID=34406 RepID=A0AAX4IGC5_9PEZI|nr:Putative cytochrome P450 [Colletotrichum destructivum]
MDDSARDRGSLLSKLPPVLFPLALVSFLSIYLLLFRLRYARQRHSNLPLPPGPPQLPIVGNLFNSPFHLRWLTHYQWRHIYGPVVHFKVGRQSTIVLTTVEAAHELLNKRASNYSDRSFGYMTTEMVTKGYNMLFRRYDSQLRLHQRLHAHGLNPRSAALYEPIQDMESLQLLNDMLSKGKLKADPSDGGKEMDGVAPQDPHWDFRRASASSISLVIWGYRLMKGHPGTKEQMDFFENNPTAAVAGGPIPLIDTFTWLKHVPYLISPWKRAGEKYHQSEAEHHVKNFRRGLRQPGYNVSKQIANGVERLGARTSEAEMAWIAATLTLANSETSVSILSWFVVAMITYPHMMRKAQAMLDEVVGQQRLPVYEDRARLPYIDAMIEEVMRWRPILPAGMDHAVAEEDEYMGYRIPAGATVVASQWAITRDKAVFGADSDDFRPERWLEGQDLPKISFGYGRRLCPGRHVGRDGLWIMFARLLWAFEMEAPTEAATGKKVVIDPMAMPPLGIVIAPKPFEALFKPRGEWVEELVHGELERSEKGVETLMEQIGAAKGLR